MTTFMIEQQVSAGEALCAFSTEFHESDPRLIQEGTYDSPMSRMREEIVERFWLGQGLEPTHPDGSKRKVPSFLFDALFAYSELEQNQIRHTAEHGGVMEVVVYPDCARVLAIDNDTKGTPRVLESLIHEPTVEEIMAKEGNLGLHGVLLLARRVVVLAGVEGKCIMAEFGRPQSRHDLGVEALARADLVDVCEDAGVALGAYDFTSSKAAA